MSPVLGSSRPMKPPFCTLNHRMPFLSNSGVCGSRAFGSGIGKNLYSPVFTSSSPMWPPQLPAYQMLPSLSLISPWGPPLIGIGYSLISPVLGSSRPSRFANCPDHHSEPSGIASGSWGRSPGVGSDHCWNGTCAGPPIAAGLGRGFSGNLAIRYALMWPACSSVIGAPADFIILTVLSQSSDDLFELTMLRRLWQTVQLSWTSFLA